MTSELGLRFLGMFILAILGARLGIQIAAPPFGIEMFALIFGLVGAITGLVVTPYVTTRPARYIRRTVTTMSAEVLLTSILGLVIGLDPGGAFSRSARITAPTIQPVGSGARRYCDRLRDDYNFRRARPGYFQTDQRPAARLSAHSCGGNQYRSRNANSAGYKCDY